MSNIFVVIRRAEIFQNFLLQDCFKWDFERPADVERIKQWEEIFITAYDDVINKRVGGDNCDSYIKCREYICKNWQKENIMKTEKVLPTILDAAKDIRESYKLYGVSDYVKQYDSMLLGGYT